MNRASFGHLPAENHPISPAPKPRKNLEKQEDFYENWSYQEAESN